MEELALFSRNEDADDIQTAHLRFILLPYLLGEWGAAAACCGGVWMPPARTGRCSSTQGRS